MKVKRELQGITKEAATTYQAGKIKQVSGIAETYNLEEWSHGPGTQNSEEAVLADW